MLPLPALQLPAVLHRSPRSLPCFHPSSTSPLQKFAAISKSFASTDFSGPGVLRFRNLICLVCLHTVACWTAFQAGHESPTHGQGNRSPGAVKRWQSVSASASPSASPSADVRGPAGVVESRCRHCLNDDNGRKPGVAGFNGCGSEEAISEVRGRFPAGFL